jgi:RhtB (resistance to homoserine/threonine) family protein
MDYLMNSTFLTVTIIGVLAVVSPGPDFLIVTRNSLLYSRRVGLATAFGIAVGNVWWVAASILGISLVISRTVLLFTTIKWLGALYLIYLGVRALCSRKKPQTAHDEPTRRNAKDITTLSAFRIGLLTNVLNPKCGMFFVSFFSIIITPKTPALLQYAYGLEIMLIAVCWFSLLATVLSVDKIKGVFERFSVWLDRVTGVILITVGVRVAFSH